MPEALIADFGKTVVAWQRRHGRNTLPWQNTRDPYRVWLSEVMLQQTQVTTVLGYYERFLERWPRVTDLAAATLDEVLAQWAGLGYYSRARNLHSCARAVAELHGGEFPPTAAGLQTLPGIGRSTAAAIAAFCFGERVAILDGNVKRVLGRVLAFDGDLASSAAEKTLWAHATELLPERDVDRYTQGLMDLGATVCTARSPDCARCPVQPLCRAQQAGDPTRWPVKTKKLRRGRRENWWLWVEGPGGQVLLQQRPATGVWAGLWTLPMFDDEAGARAALPDACLETLPRIEHALTHFDWVLHTLRARAPEGMTHGGTWVAREKLASYALPAPLKKLIDES
ncbi:A/G-specific adenine glycosylase [Roseateles saccharophilus]|uniref:Adenine DNA glycosylase n=1 Tax=Roseateles saccharophilus TaxID=304 RepID=A0A4R3UV00_ROSSA|nr:A/G-specific adenine glycosylase [Roseateles saccharophilus]MDG0833281.1 A/G-specific adenine glycosylase [Roseateles saccharophilus]TCU94368.1 A/G-specific DNA-adenine glycosylase [Roseateles saccharophilus]